MPEDDDEEIRNDNPFCWRARDGLRRPAGVNKTGEGFLRLGSTPYLLRRRPGVVAANQKLPSRLANQ